MPRRSYMTLSLPMRMMWLTSSGNCELVTSVIVGGGEFGVRHVPGTVALWTECQPTTFMFAWPSPFMGSSRTQPFPPQADTLAKRKRYVEALVRAVARYKMRRVRDNEMHSASEIEARDDACIATAMKHLGWALAREKI